MDDVLTLILAHRWWALAAVLIGAVVRTTKSDLSFLPTLPPAWRPRLALGLGVVAGVCKALGDGASAEQALAWGLGAAAAAIVGHDVLIEGMRQGWELGERKPKTPPPDDSDGPAGANGSAPPRPPMPPALPPPGMLQRCFDRYRPLAIVAVLLAWPIAGTIVGCSTAQARTAIAVADVGCVILTRTLEPGSEALCANASELAEAVLDLSAASRGRRALPPPETPEDARRALFDAVKARRARGGA